MARGEGESPRQAFDQAAGGGAHVARGEIIGPEFHFTARLPKACEWRAVYNIQHERRSPPNSEVPSTTLEVEGKGRRQNDRKKKKEKKRVCLKRGKMFPANPGGGHVGGKIQKASFSGVEFVRPVGEKSQD